MKEPRSLNAILAQEHASLNRMRRVTKQGLMLLNPGELSGDLKDPDGSILYAYLCSEGGGREWHVLG